MPIQIQDGNGFGQVTQTSGTKIRTLIPGIPAYRTRLNTLVYLAGATAHTLTVSRSLGTTTITTAASSGQANVIVTADPGPAGNGISAGDLIAVFSAVDGITRLYIVNTWTSVSRTINFTTNLVVNATVGDRIWDFGIEADTDPVWGLAQPTFAGVASVTSTYTGPNSLTGLIAGNNVGDPILVSSNNATNQGFLQQTSFFYTTP